MNFFGIGGAELVLIVLIMLIVAGPKRMLQWAYVMGIWVGKARAMWQQAVVVLQKEMDDAGVGIKLPNEPPTRQTLTRMVSDAVKPYTEELESTYRQTDQQVRGELPKSTAKAASSAKAPAGVPAKATSSLGAWESVPAPDATPDAAKADPSGLGSWSVPREGDS